MNKPDSLKPLFGNPPTAANSAAVAVFDAPVSTVVDPDPLLMAKTPAPQTLAVLQPKVKATMAIVLNSEQKAASAQLAKQSLVNMKGQDVVLFGSERQRALGAALDTLLDGITKGSSPLLFELFGKLKKGVDGVKVDELEEQIKSTLGKSVTSRLLDAIGLDSVAKRAARASDQVSSMLVSKSKSLREVMAGMETQINAEIQRLLLDVANLEKLAVDYTANIGEFAVYVDAGYKMLADGRKAELAMLNCVKQNNDPVQAQQFKSFQRTLDLFESRVLVLETAYAKAPGQLDAIGLAEGAALTTLSETANSILEEFNDIKSSLISLSVMYQLQSVQQVNAERRKLREVLQRHSLNVLDNVAVTAAQLQGDNRLEDAVLLSSFATGIKTISDKVTAKLLENKQKFEQARIQLTAAQQIFSEVKTLQTTV